MITFTQNMPFNPEWVAIASDDYCATATAPQHFVWTDTVDYIGEQRPSTFQTS